jgi:hypothetical protein
MATPDSNLSTLDKIRIKVRRITRNPSEAQITTDEIDDYINNFILYSMPAYIKLDSLKGVFTFFTHPGIDTYRTETVDTSDPFYNFKNKYTNIMSPVYIDGTLSHIYRSREEFYNIYPNSVDKVIMAVGDGLTTNFTYTGPYPVVRESVVVSTISSATNETIVVTDNGEGELIGDVDPLSTFSYSTGQIYISFLVPPASGENIWLSVETFESSKPISILFYENNITVRPIPDKTYKVEIDAYKRPSELLNSSDMPDLSEWWEYISIGAAIKILKDRLDIEGVSLLLPMFKEQEILIGRRKIIQLAGQRTPTIFSEGE